MSDYRKGGFTLPGEAGYEELTLKMAENHYTAQMSYMEGICCGIKTHVGCNLFLVKKFIGTGHHLVNHASPGKFFNKISHNKYRILLKSAQMYNSLTKGTNYKDRRLRLFRIIRFCMVLILSFRTVAASSIT